MTDNKRLLFTAEDAEHTLRHVWTGTMLGTKKEIVEKLSEPLAMISIDGANARLAPLVEALERLAGVGDMLFKVNEHDVDAAREAVHAYMAAAGPVLAEYRKLREGK